VTNLRREFGGVLAIPNLSFDAGSGEILAVIGPIGAGKTTAFNPISSVLPATGGEIPLMDMLWVDSLLTPLPVWAWPQRSRLYGCSGI
jgi:ABC-type branched-subunit amino acid transport system ATPase component